MVAGPRRRKESLRPRRLRIIDNLKGNLHCQQAMGGVTAYFDLDGTLLDASSEKTLTGMLSRRRPWRIPIGATMWCLGFFGNLIRGRSIYDAARNRGIWPCVIGKLYANIQQNWSRQNYLKGSVLKPLKD